MLLFMCLLLVICTIYIFSNDLKRWKPSESYIEGRHNEEPVLTSSMEDMIKKSQKQENRLGETLSKRVKQLWKINEDIIELGTTDVHPTTARNQPNTISLREEDRIRIDNFFRKRKQSVKLDSSNNNSPVNLAVYLSYINTKPVTSKSSTLSTIIDEDNDLSTSDPIRLTLQPVNSEAKEKTVNRLISELKSQFVVEGNKVKMTDLKTFLNQKVVPMIESNKLDNRFVF